MRGFLIFLLVAALIGVGVYMSNEDCYFWDIVEAEAHLLIWGACFILAFTGDNAPLEKFRDGGFAAALKSLAFLPVCAAVCYFSARYGGDLVTRCMEALLKWEPVDFSPEFTTLGGVWGEYPQYLFTMGLAYSPIIWAVCVGLTRKLRYWPVAVLVAALLSALTALINYIIALTLAIIILIVMAIGAVAMSKEDPEEEERRRRRERGW